MALPAGVAPAFSGVTSRRLHYFGLGKELNLAGDGGFAPPTADLETAVMLTSPIPYGPGDENRTRSCSVGRSHATITPRPDGPPNRNRTGITWLEARRSTVELWAAVLEDFFPLDRMMEGGPEPSRPGATIPVLYVPARLSRGAFQRVAALGSGARLTADGRQSPVPRAHRPSRVGGYNKKTPASFRARGFQFFRLFSSCHPRARIPSVWWLESRRDWTTWYRDTSSRRNPDPTDGMSLVPRLAVAWLLTSVAR
jgi:hypothetical protein